MPDVNISTQTVVCTVYMQAQITLMSYLYDDLVKCLLYLFTFSILTRDLHHPVVAVRHLLEGQLWDAHSHKL